jgi:CubicO group peptidase (beta-lactamase class C family)
VTEVTDRKDAIVKKQSNATMTRRELGVLGIAGAIGAALPGAVRAQTTAPTAAGSSSVAAGKPVITAITSITDPISKAKNPLPLDFIKAARERFSFPNWQAGGDDSVYYNMHIPEFFNCGIAVPVMEARELKRKINRHLDDLTFKAKDGSTTPKLKDYLAGPKRVQAMIMAHKGRVVFEAYPGMNPTDMHIWMSASKTTFGLMVMYLEADGKVDMEKPITAYATQLKGTAWDKVSLKNAMNMATGLDIEESFANLTNPKSWIGKFFTAMMSTGAAGDWIQVMREAEPLPGEPAGTYMRYSTAITQALALVVENVSNLSYADYFQKRVWSKLGVKDPFLVALLSDKTALAGGGNFTAIEDFLRYAMIYTPSWKKVSEERIVTDALLKRIQTLGDPKAFEGCTEQQYGHEWFGELAERNSAQWDDVRGRRHVQAWQHGPRHLCRPGPRLLRSPLRSWPERRPGRLVPGLPTRRGEDVRRRLTRRP